MPSLTAGFRSVALFVGPALLLWAGPGAPPAVSPAASPSAAQTESPAPPQTAPNPDAWQTATDLPMVDLSGLTAPQKAAALKVLRDFDCTCQCGMKVAECRVKDPKCYYSRGLSQAIVTAIKAGKSGDDARKAARESDYAHVQQQQEAPLLEPAIPLSLNGAPSVGPVNAPITLVEFSDFQCPYCAVAAPELHRVMRAFPQQIRLVFKEFPLDIHPLAPLAAAAAVAADKQGKFWDMHDAMFARRHSLDRDGLIATARDLGLDMDKFTADLDSDKVKAVIAQDMREGDQVPIRGTPTLFINGQRYNGPLNLLALRSVLEQKFKATPAPNPAAPSLSKGE
jgi:protein-disulfide isomerase